MDAALYSLIGAVSGIAVTQLANYFLESKKSKNAYNLKKLELDFSQKSTDKHLKRDAYSQFFNDVDVFKFEDISTMDKLTNSFYKAMIVAEKSTQTELIKVFNMRKNENPADPLNTDEFLKAKGGLLKIMHEEISR